jgi:hypothetical protein
MSLHCEEGYTCLDDSFNYLSDVSLGDGATVECSWALPDDYCRPRMCDGDRLNACSVDADCAPGDTCAGLDWVDINGLTCSDNARERCLWDYQFGQQGVGLTESEKAMCVGDANNPPMLQAADAYGTYYEVALDTLGCKSFGTQEACDAYAFCSSDIGGFSTCLTQGFSSPGKVPGPTDIYITPCPLPTPDSETERYTCHLTSPAMNRSCPFVPWEAPVVGGRRQN